MSSWRILARRPLWALLPPRLVLRASRAWAAPLRALPRAAERGGRGEERLQAASGSAKAKLCLGDMVKALTGRQQCHPPRALLLEHHTCFDYSGSHTLDREA